MGKNKEIKKLELEPEQTKSREELWLEYDREISKKTDINLLEAALKEMDIVSVYRIKLAKAYGRLVLELADKLPRYDTIISDDASGRVPSLVFYEIIKKERKKKDKPAPVIYFIAGGQDPAPAKRVSIFNFLKSKKGTVGKALLVTEFVNTGWSMKFLMETLEIIGIDFDIISISASTSDTWPKKLREKLLFGTWGFEGAHAHHRRREQSGVFKDSNNPSPHPERAVGVSGTVRKTRENIKVFAGELSKLLD